jgi:putative hydrolase of HD superfamily
MITLESSHDEVIAEMHRIREMYKLKRTMRYESKRDHSIFTESVGEHLFGMFVLVDYFLPLDDPEGKLDRQRVHELILYHEIGEIETGDIVSHKKTAAHSLIEQEAAKRVAAKLPESLAEKAHDRFIEFEQKVSPESLFATAIDKIEPIFELDESAWYLFKEQKWTKEILIGKKYDASKKYPYLTLFLNAWVDHLVANDVFPE